MGAKIDYVAVFKPVETILDSNKLSDAEKIEMIRDVVKEILEQSKSK